jgi:hypothetical protein
MFFKDSAWDQTRSLGSRLSELPAEANVLANIRREEQVQLKGIVRTRTPVRVPGTSGKCEAYLRPDGNFDIVSSKILVRPSWTVLHAFKTDTFQKGTHEDRLKAEEELESMIEKDPSYALKQIYLETDPSQSLYAIVEEIYSDMPALEEITDSALPNVVEAQPVDDDTPQAILDRLKQKEAVLRAEIQVYKEIQRQIQTNSQLEAELQQLKVAVGSV